MNKHARKDLIIQDNGISKSQITSNPSSLSNISLSFFLKNWTRFKTFSISLSIIIKSVKRISWGYCSREFAGYFISRVVNFRFDNGTTHLILFLIACPFSNELFGYRDWLILKSFSSGYTVIVCSYYVPIFIEIRRKMFEKLSFKNSKNIVNFKNHSTVPVNYFEYFLKKEIIQTWLPRSLPQALKKLIQRSHYERWTFSL